MRKNIWKVSVLLSLLAVMPLQSCIGSFSLTNRVLKWNKQVGTKFLNELVFFAFWILPVYEVTAIADLFVINSIEFWSGTNPAEAYIKSVETDNGTYIVKWDGKVYLIQSPDGEETQLIFDEEEKTWSLLTSEEECYPFMTLLDDSHVKMIGPDGAFHEISLDEQGLAQYEAMVYGYLPTIDIDS